MKTLSVRTGKRTEMVDITREVAQTVVESGLRTGACLVFVPHTTAAVTINENADPSVQRDIDRELTKVAPFEDGYEHDEGNSAAHVKTVMVGPSVMIPVRDGRLMLGTWQAVYLCEYDGPRSRHVHVQVLGERET